MIQEHDLLPVSIMLGTMQGVRMVSKKEAASYRNGINLTVAVSNAKHPDTWIDVSMYRDANGSMCLKSNEAYMRKGNVVHNIFWGWHNRDVFDCSTDSRIEEALVTAEAEMESRILELEKTYNALSFLGTDTRSGLVYGYRFQALATAMKYTDCNFVLKTAIYDKTTPWNVYLMSDKGMYYVDCMKPRKNMKRFISNIHRKNPDGRSEYSIALEMFPDMAMKFD